MPSDVRGSGVAVLTEGNASHFRAMTKHTRTLHEPTSRRRATAWHWSELGLITWSSIRRPGYWQRPFRILMQVPPPLIDAPTTIGCTISVQKRGGGSSERRQSIFGMQKKPLVKRGVVSSNLALRRYTLILSRWVRIACT